MSKAADSPIDSIPDPPTIRARLAHLMREQDLLRALLRVAERKRLAGAVPTAERREEAAHASS